MQIISDKKFWFREGSKHHHVLPSPNVQQVPAWIAETHLFKLAQKDGSIKIVTGHAPKKKALVPEVEGLEKLSEGLAPETADGGESGDDSGQTDEADPVPPAAPNSSRRRSTRRK